MIRGLAAAGLAAALAVAAALPAFAQGEPARPKPQKAQAAPAAPAAPAPRPPARGGTDLPAVISADEVNYDRENETVRAKGNVHIFQGDRVVLANEVVYDRRNRKVTATGNVSLTEPGGHTIFGERVELSDDLKEGVIYSFGLLFPDKSRAAANGAIRTGGDTTEMSRVVFTPCYTCKDNPDAPPLWQIRARKVVHDQKTNDIRYYDGVFEIYGRPIFYTPFFMHPDPTVRRRTGLLAPVFGSGSGIGTFVRLPVFVVLDQDKDATITPIVTTRARVGLFGEYRQRWRGGALIAEGSANYVRHREENGLRTSQNDFRGHLGLKLRQDIDANWRAGLEGMMVTDDTYLRVYGVTGVDAIVSRAWTEGFFDRNYASLRVVHFRGLRREDDQHRLIFAAPAGEYHAFGAPVGEWGRWNFSATLAALHRIRGTDSRRFSAQAGWLIPFTHRDGWQLNVAASLNADLYWVTGVEAGGNPTFSGTRARVYPQVRLDWRYPFVRELGNVRHVVEPRVAFVASTPNLNTWKIPNEDSIEFEFDDVNLYSDNRYPGRDRIDDGGRIVYGVNNAFYGNLGGRTEFFLGQSVRLYGEDNFTETSGLRRDLSDLVGRVRIKPANYLDLLYRFRFDPSETRFRRHELAVRAGVPAFNVTANFIDLAGRTNTASLPDRREVTLTARSQITENWSVGGSLTYDFIGANKLRLWGFDAAFKNECCTIGVGFQRTQTADRDIQPGNRFLVQVVFKHLGEVRGGR